MNTHPTATLHMANGSKIVIELLPEAAPNTVNSFIYAASRDLLISRFRELKSMNRLSRKSLRKSN